MPQDNYTEKLLDMEHMEIREIKITDATITARVRMKLSVSECPACGALTDHVHDYRIQRVKDTPIQGKHFIWEYEKRRYACSCGKRFYEKNYLLPKWHRITNRVAILSLNMLKTKQSMKAIAQSLGVSPSSVLRWLQLVENTKPKALPTVLSIDEFKGNAGGNKFQCILTAPEEKKIVDILPTRSVDEITSYLRSFSNRGHVKYFITDMNRDYVGIAKALFPKATIVIDRFHVVRYCTWALENVRKRVQAKLLPEQRKYFKRSRRLLLCHMSKLSAENKEAVEHMLTYSADLRDAYLLKEVFYEFMASVDSRRAKEKLKQFFMHAQVSNIPEFEPCLTMLRNWSDYILNAFDCSYSNGFTEGENNSIKVIKRIAYGYHNFFNFRRRILLCCNT